MIIIICTLRYVLLVDSSGCSIFNRLSLLVRQRCEVFENGTKRTKRVRANKMRAHEMRLKKTNLNERTRRPWPSRAILDIEDRCRGNRRDFKYRVSRRDDFASTIGLFSAVSQRLRHLFTITGWFNYLLVNNYARAHHL